MRPRRFDTLSDSGDGGAFHQPPAKTKTEKAQKPAKRRKRARARNAGRNVELDAPVSSGSEKAARVPGTAPIFAPYSPGGERDQKKKRRRNRRRSDRAKQQGAQPGALPEMTPEGRSGKSNTAETPQDKVRAAPHDRGPFSNEAQGGPEARGRETGGPGGDAKGSGRRGRGRPGRGGKGAPKAGAEADRAEGNRAANAGRSGNENRGRRGDKPGAPSDKRPSQPDKRNMHGPRGAGGGAARPAASGETRIARAERNPRAGGYRGTLYAALDLGTNNCRLLVAKPEGRSFRVVDAYSRIVRLGEGIGSSRRLSEAAMLRAIEALKVCGEKLANCGSPLRARLIATEACRGAENGPLFIERVREETGLALEIVTRETEARLAVAGCSSLVAPEADGVVLFDIGGGSSELVWLDLRNRCGARGLALTRFIRHWTSLPLGVVTLAERHGGTRVGTDNYEAMVEDVTSHLSSFSMGPMLSEAIAAGGVHMLGTSGTVTTLAGMHLGLERYDRRRVDGTWLADNDVSAMIARLLAMPYEERVDNPCIGADRADLVLAGCAILEAIRRRWPCERLRVADRGLREGILMELMHADRKGRQSGRNRS